MVIFLVIVCTSYLFLTSLSGNTNHSVSFLTLKWIGQKQKEVKKKSVLGSALVLVSCVV